jgi:hypothetical protein
MDRPALRCYSDPFDKRSNVRSLTCLALLGLGPLWASEQEALDISSYIRSSCIPYGSVLGPVYASPESDEIVSYSRCGDSAIWTGHYLAAEAHRYAVTHSADALDSVRVALDGIRALVDVTGTGLPARCLVPVDSPHTLALMSEEAGHGIFAGTVDNLSYYWVGNTSRDQYSGVFFGLGAAYDLVDEPEVRESIRDLITRLLSALLQNNWLVRMPDGAISTTFIGRPDQQLSFLQTGRRVNPGRFDWTYKWYRFWLAGAVQVPIALEALDDHNSYFKFNLDTINLYNLIRLEDSSYYRERYIRAYDILRRTTEDHGNAHFNMIDRALKGPAEGRDAETRALLEVWLERPRRDEWVDWRGIYAACQSEAKACEPVPVRDRVRTDFLWQRSPFQLYGGGQGNIATPGIDYILPYWMARYYQVLE